MGDISVQLQILNESKARVRALKFGDPVTNICAGEGNPTRHSIFVQYVTKTYKSRFGISHNDYYAKCTDGKGKFWNAGIEVIYPGHLNDDECNRLFQPVWEAKFGEKK